MRTTRNYLVEDLLYAASDEEDAYHIASEWLEGGSFSDSNHDGEGDLTQIFAIGSHQLTEVARVSEVGAKSRELYGIHLPGFYLGDIDASGAPLLRQKEELEVFRLQRLDRDRPAAT